MYLMHISLFYIISVLNYAESVNTKGNRPYITKVDASDRQYTVNNLGHDYPSHYVVPIGMPSNSIEKIVVDARLVGTSRYSQLINKIQQNKLCINIYDKNGNLIFDATKNFKYQSTAS